MDAATAYNTTLSEIYYLGTDCGIQMCTVEAVTKNDPDFIEDIDEKSNNLPPENWTIVEFFPETQKERNLIFKAEERLEQKGISFDTGGGQGLREWMIDYSFTFGNEESDLLRYGSHDDQIEEAWEAVVKVA